MRDGAPRAGAAAAALARRAERALHRVGVRDRRDGRAHVSRRSTRSSGGCCSRAGTSRRATRRSRRRRCARRARRRRSSSSCIRRRRGRSTSTSTGFPTGRASRRTGTSTSAIWWSGAASRGRARRGIRSARLGTRRSSASSRRCSRSEARRGLSSSGLVGQPGDRLADVVAAGATSFGASGVEERGEHLDLVAARAELELAAAVEGDPVPLARVVEIEEAPHRAEPRRLAVQAARLERQRFDVAPLVDRGVPGDPVAMRRERLERLGGQRGILEPGARERLGDPRVELRDRAASRTRRGRCP